MIAKRRAAIMLAVGAVAVVLAIAVRRTFVRDAGAAAERTVDLRYRLLVTDIPPGAKRVRAWVPIPPSHSLQRLEGLRVSGDPPRMIVPEPEYGNRFLRLDLTGAPRGQDGRVGSSVTFRVRRRACDLSDPAEERRPLSAAEVRRFLAPDSLVPIGGRIAQEAERVAGDLEDPLAKAQRLYDHIVVSLEYDTSGEGWGRGDALHACDVRMGNCTDFHSLFIAEARALGIPARFVMGVPLPEDRSAGGIPGYHCWAEFYVRKRGWVPVDASEAHKRPEKKIFFFGGLDEHRVEFTVGRDIRIPGTSVGPVNYVIWPHVEVDGRPHAGMVVELHFSDVRADLTISRQVAHGRGAAGES